MTACKGRKLAEGKMRIGILGAGVMGLSTAVRLQELLGSAPHLTIIADKFGQEVVSDAAAGSFRSTIKPRVDGYEGLRKDPGLDIVTLTYKQWERLYQTCAKEAGVIETEGYDLYYPPQTTITKDPLYREILSTEKTRQLTNEDLYSRFPTLPPGSLGYEIKTLLVSPRTYLPWLMNRFKNHGGKVVKQHVSHFDELIDDYDVLVNCTGYLAGTLTGDQDILPSRGQIYRANIPERRGRMLMINTNDERPIYFYDTPDGLVLGGTKQIGNWSNDFNAEDHEYIMTEMSKYLPDVQNLESRITSVRVEHRPHRERGIRLEKEVRVKNSRKIWIVHHYGHGASGISYSWGSAILAAEVVQGLMKECKL